MLQLVQTVRDMLTANADWKLGDNDGLKGHAMEKKKPTIKKKRNRMYRFAFFLQSEKNKSIWI